MAKLKWRRELEKVGSAEIYHFPTEHIVGAETFNFAVKFLLSGKF